MAVINTPGIPNYAVLVVGRSNEHLSQLKNCFDSCFDALYVTYGTNIVGRQFDRIIVVDSEGYRRRLVTVEAAKKFDQWISELHSRTRTANSSVHFI